MSPSINSTEIRPFVVLSSVNGKLGRSEVANSISYFSKHDDVFSSDFLTDFIGVLGKDAESVGSWDFQNLDTVLGPWNVKSIFTVASGSEGSIAPGPYFLCGGSIHQAWKLYADDLDAFSVAVYPRDVLTDNTT